jgi:hypothetical protein
MERERDYERDGGYRQYWCRSPIERYTGGDGPLARAAQRGGGEDEWTRVSRRRRKVPRPAWNGQDRFQQGSDFDDRYSYRGDWRFNYGNRLRDFAASRREQGEGFRDSRYHGVRVQASLGKNRGRSTTRRRYRSAHYDQ